ncbi:MAG: hypothetical protein R3C25_04590 [Hyphomonadaceae bacterium]
MRWCVALVSMALAACGQHAPNPYPESAHAQFEASCPHESLVCTCTWDRITRTMSYEQYDAALQAFRETGLMDPHITRARTQCIERHGNS